MNTEDRLREIIKIPITIKQMIIGDFNINYALAGSGPPLLLIHGANFGWGVWYPNIAELAQNFTIYAIDLPGAGRSTRINYAKMDPEKDLVWVTEEFIDKLGFEKFSVIGCSIGGWLALRLALKYPERVNKVIVENSIGFTDYMSSSDRVIGFYPFAKFISTMFINSKSRKSVEKFLRGIFYNRDLSLSEAFIDYFYETMQTSHNLLFISRLTALHKELIMKGQLASIKSKILVIWGGKDKIIPLEKNMKYFKLIPDVQISIIEDAGHIPSLEKPEEFNIITKFFLIKST